jgi:methionyl-tRNA formyltransferase
LLDGPSFAAARSAPGTLIGAKNDWFISCGNATLLRLQSVKIEGRKQISASEFANGARLKPGERFGDTDLRASKH